MARTKITLMTCPQGHSFITLQSFGHAFTCTECDESFDSWEGGIDLSSEDHDEITRSAPRLSS